jgi:hypothetical protein
MKKLLLLASFCTSLAWGGSTPVLYQTNTENIMDVPFNTGVPYMFWSPYTLIIPNLVPTDVIHITSRAEVTNPFNFPVMVGWYLSNSWSYGSTRIPPAIGVTPVTQDIGIGHFVPSIDVWVTGYTGTTVFALILYGASSYGSGYLILERGYGTVQAAVFSK